MDAAQTDHLRAYGVVYRELAKGVNASWLLNYRGGSFAMDYSYAAWAACRSSGVAAAEISDATWADIVKRIKAPGNNGAVIKLDRPPRIAVYTPSGKMPWDDAVTLALTYAGIPFTKVYADEVLAGALSQYEWLHLHHEDFTGRYGKFWMSFHDAEWYKRDVARMEALAAKHGFAKVSQMQLAIARRVTAFLDEGGNLFAMCSATETIDIALAAAGLDICAAPYDGDGEDEDVQKKLHYGHCLAFRNFTVSTAPFEYGHSDIDNVNARIGKLRTDDSFTLRRFQARTEPVLSMLCQNHVQRIAGFMGQTTAFRREVLRPGVTVLGERRDINEARYIHGTHGRGVWTFYGGHDPEDYQHMVNDPPTDLSLHPHSPGYRLILNNVLCMASEHAPVKAQQPAAESRPFVKIAPGTSGSELMISAAEGAGTVKITEVTFHNAAGKVVQRSPFQGGKSVSVDMSLIPAGTYTVYVNGRYAGMVRRD